MSGNGFKEIVSLDRLIHEPARLMIMTILYAVEEADFVYLQRECGLTQGNLSSHLGKLEEAGYITISKSFKGKYPLTVCKATRKGQAALQGYSEKMQLVTKTLAGHTSRWS
jgi:DNA-binding transcriptional ArsR family regulator